MSHAAPDAAADDGRGTSPLRWLAMGLAALTVFSSYYESDAFGSIADLLIRQRGFTQSQIGDLTAVISLPNIALAVFNGLLIDRFGAARFTLWAAIIGFIGAVMTAIGTPYELMRAGRFAIRHQRRRDLHLADRLHWRNGSRAAGIALATSVFLSLARLGSFSLDTSPTWARPLYESGWQAPLWLGAGITGVGLIAAIILRLIDGQRAPVAAVAPASHERVRWSQILAIRSVLLVHHSGCTCCTPRSSFRSDRPMRSSTCSTSRA